MYGGYGESSRNRAFKQVHAFNPLSKKWSLRRFKNNKAQKGRINGSSCIVRENGKQKLMIFGGKASILGRNEKDVLVLNFKDFNLWWSLHFLSATKIQRKVGYNMCWEVMGMLQGDNNLGL